MMNRVEAGREKPGFLLNRAISGLSLAEIAITILIVSIGIFGLNRLFQENRARIVNLRMESQAMFLADQMTGFIEVAGFFGGKVLTDTFGNSMRIQVGGGATGDYFGAWQATMDAIAVPTMEGTVARIELGHYLITLSWGVDGAAMCPVDAGGFKQQQNSKDGTFSGCYIRNFFISSAGA